MDGWMDGWMGVGLPWVMGSRAAAAAVASDCFAAFFFFFFLFFLYSVFLLSDTCHMPYEIFPMKRWREIYSLSRNLCGNLSGNDLAI